MTNSNNKTLKSGWEGNGMKPQGSCLTALQSQSFSGAEERDLCGNKMKGGWVHFGSTYAEVRKVGFASMCTVHLMLGRCLTFFDSASLKGINGN